MAARKKTYPLVKAAEEYARRVVAGKIAACKWIKLACQRHLDDLERAKEDGFAYYFDPAKAEKVAKFLQLLPHTKGKWASKRELIKLEGWQLFSVCIPFGWLQKKDNTRRFRTIVIFVPRKNGKSIIGGGLGIYMFTADGEFGAEVYSGATTEKQAWEVFRPAKLMVERTPELKEHFGVDVNASNMCRMEDGSRFEPVIGKPGDGSSPSCAIVDEYHEHQDSTLFDTMETGMGAREQPVMLVITTAGSSIGGPCHQLVRDAERMLEGVIERPDLWAMLYTIDSQPYMVVHESYHAIKRLDEICQTGSAAITLTKKCVQEACARAVTQHGVVPTALADAQITQIAQREPASCVALATIECSESAIQPIKSDKTPIGASGHGRTRKKSAQSTSVGELSLAAEKKSWRSTERLGTACLKQSTSSDIWLAVEDAKSAKSKNGFYASTIATVAELFEGSSAGNAILQLVCLEILKTLFAQHSNTLRGLGLDLGERGLVETVPADDWTSEQALVKANPNYGVSISGDFLQARQRDAMQSAAKQATFRTKHLNEWVGAKNAWLNMLRWKEAPARKSLTELEGRRCIAALDLASKIDIAGLLLLFPPIEGDPLWHVHGRYYLPEARVIEELDSNTARYREFDSLGLLTLTDGEVIDFEVIKEDLREFAGRFQIEQVAYDPWQATQLAQEMQAEGLLMVEVRQTVQNLSEPMKEVEALVLQRKLAHGDCPILTWMASNVVAKLDAKDNIYPNKERPENKIDGIVGLIMGVRQAISGGDKDPDIADFIANPVVH